MTKVEHKIRNNSVDQLQKRSFEIAPGRWVGDDCPCFVVAEIGQNHQGDIEIAKKLIQCAKECEVDCVKFQKTNIQSRFTQEVLNRPYKSVNSWGETYGKHREKIELTEQNFLELNQYSNSLGIYFTASGMDKPSIDFLNSLNVPFFKIGSADTTNLPLLKHASKYKKPLVISTGMTSSENVIKMYDEISQLNQCLAIMQCTSSYPTTPNEVNLNIIKTYADLFPKAVIGYSGHEIGIEISVAAVAVGAKILERHITLDHSLKGSDHAASLEPNELKQLVTEVRRIEDAMGSFKKEIQDSERPCYEKLGKTVVANKFLPRGTIIKEDMINVKVATKKGCDPIIFYDLIGKILKKDYKEEESIMPEDILEN